MAISEINMHSFAKSVDRDVAWYSYRGSHARERVGLKVQRRCLKWIVPSHGSRYRTDVILDICKLTWIKIGASCEID
jgi:hypothetical protein